jgi:hypothetical protein
LLEHYRFDDWEDLIGYLYRAVNRLLAEFVA